MAQTLRGSPNILMGAAQARPNSACGGQLLSYPERLFTCTSTVRGEVLNPFGPGIRTAPRAALQLFRPTRLSRYLKPGPARYCYHIINFVRCREAKP